MKKITYIIILTIGMPFTSLTQSLTDSVFVSLFDSVEFNINTVNPAKRYSDWQLIAGYCEIIDKGYSELKKKKIKDSLWIVRQNKINMLGEWYDSCVIECEKRKLNEHCNDYCDSIYEFKYHLTKETFIKSVHKLIFNNNYFISEQYRIGKNSKKIDSLIKEYDFCKSEGFGTWCPPNGCNWFLVAFLREKIEIIDTYDKLIDFIGIIDNASDAFLLMLASELASSNGYPTKSANLLSYKTDNNFYFIMNIQLVDCPIEIYKCLVKVTNKGKVLIIDKILIKKDDICI